MPNKRARTRDPFETLIATVISQQANSEHTAKAVENLSKEFELTPEALSKACVEEIESACVKNQGNLCGDNVQ